MCLVLVCSDDPIIFASSVNQELLFSAFCNACTQYSLSALKKDMTECTTANISGLIISLPVLSTCSGQCEVRSRQSWGFCQCDSVCFMYGDCCLDYEAVCLDQNASGLKVKKPSTELLNQINWSLRYSLQRFELMECREVYFNAVKWLVPIIVRCPMEHKKVHPFQELCSTDIEDSNPRSNFLKHIPAVFDSLIYANVFCAICNKAANESDIEEVESRTKVLCARYPLMTYSAKRYYESVLQNCILQPIDLIGANPSRICPRGRDLSYKGCPEDRNSTAWHMCTSYVAHSPISLFNETVSSGIFKNPHCELLCEPSMNYSTTCHPNFVTRGQTKSNHFEVLIDFQRKTSFSCPSNYNRDDELNACVSSSCSWAPEKHGINTSACYEVSSLGLMRQRAYNSEITTLKIFKERVVGPASSLVPVPVLPPPPAIDSVLDESFEFFFSNSDSLAPLLKEALISGYKYDTVTTAVFGSGIDMAVVLQDVQTFAAQENNLPETSAVSWWLSWNRTMPCYNYGSERASIVSRSSLGGSHIWQTVMVLEAPGLKYKSLSAIWQIGDSELSPIILVYCETPFLLCHDVVILWRESGENLKESWWPLPAVYWAGNVYLACKKDYSAFHAHIAWENEVKLILTYICLSISMLSLSLTVTVYSLLPSLRTASGKCIIGLSISLFLAQGARQVVHLVNHHTGWCTAIAVISHWLWLITFLWMTLLGFDTTTTLCSMKLIDKHQANVNFQRYLVITLSVPTLLVVSCAFAFEFLSIPIYDPLYHCWLQHGWTSVWLFGIPVLVLIIVNITLFLRTVIHLKLSKSSTKNLHKNHRYSVFMVSFRLLSAMGLTWISAFLAEIPHIKFMGYFAIIFNGLQGLFIFLSFVCKKQVLEMLKDLIAVKILSQAPTHQTGSVQHITSAT